MVTNVLDKCAIYCSKLVQSLYSDSTSTNLLCICVDATSVTYFKAHTLCEIVV